MIQLGGSVPPQMNGQVGMSNELNDRLDSALQQIETVSRQLCSVQDNTKIGQFQNGTTIGQQVSFIDRFSQLVQYSVSTDVSVNVVLAGFKSAATKVFI